jgi:hypothetical protein
MKIQEQSYEEYSRVPNDGQPQNPYGIRSVTQKFSLLTSGFSEELFTCLIRLDCEQRT